MNLVLVDGYNMAFRAFYGMPELAREDGFPTGALHGWVRTLWWIEDQLKPEPLRVFFDLGGAQRQLAIREDYKANRSETPAALEQQIPVLKEWTRAMGYGGIEKDGVEADDLIAAWARYWAGEGEAVTIVSADKDLAQLVDERISIMVPPPTANPKLGWRRLDPQGVEDKFGLPASQIADYLALVGDTADNIPGVKGVGPKTAVKWLRQYRNIEGIIQHCGELQPKRFQQLVHSEQEILRQNLEMTTLDANHEIVATEAIPPVDPDRAISILEEMEMGRTVEKLKERLAR